jgi:small subunit ribosomal protein S6
MKTYELTYIIPEKFEEKEIPQISEKIKKLLPDGKIIKEEFWGRRKLAYPILKNNFGYYITLVFETEPENIKKITNKLKLAEDIIRYLIVQSEKTEKPVMAEGEKKKPKLQTKAKPKKTEKPQKAETTEKIEKEKMKELEEKLEEILKE